MEGISGIVHGDQTTPGTAEYASGRKWMAQDVNAAVEGALEAGATEVVVNDSHGSMRNIDPDDLHPKAILISGYIVGAIDDAGHRLVVPGLPVHRVSCQGGY
jgi:D-amino peptidase